MPSYNTSDFKKGIKVQIDGEPFVMVECNFVKPGKGQALYKTRLKSLFKNTVLDRTYKSGDSLEAADVHDSTMQYLYRDGENFVFMDPETFEQPALTAAQVGDEAKWLKEGINCNITFYNGQPIAMSAPNHMVLRITYTEPGARGNSAAGNVLKAATVETGAEVFVPIFIETGELIKVDTREGVYLERVREEK